MRIALWILRVAVAAAIGMIVRYSRRIAGRKPRVWHGIVPLHLTPLMVQADRRAGFPTRSVALHTRQTRYALITAAEFDAIFETEGHWFDAHWRALIDLLLRGDIYSTQFDGLFFRPEQSRLNNLAFGLLRIAGIRIVVCAHGGDILHRDRLHTRYDWIERTQRDYPQWDLVAQEKVARERIRLFTQHARLVLPGDAALLRFLRRNDVLFKYFPIDTEALTPHYETGHDIPIIMHAPNHRFTKGTDLLLEALDRLRALGFAFELKLIEGVPRAEALQLYANADIIADQFCGGAFGAFALEGMAMGKPVLTYLDQEHLGDPVYNVPLVNANGDNLTRVLAAVLTNRTLRERLGRASRACVETYYSIDALAEVWRVIHEHVWWNAPLDLSRTRHFDPARGYRSFSEDPSDPGFWPVDVSDLRASIDDALARVTTGL
ncbi:MAG TPA: hypothetical protein VHW00_04245 [Thermoanaerobaculia bacterium]|nr:hypothetical protein [Thermoanaerobaculia bacterium]